MRTMTHWQHGQGIWPTLAFPRCFSLAKGVGFPGSNICQSSRKQKEIIAPEIASFLVNTFLAFQKITAAFISRSNSSSLRSCSSFSLWEIDAVETVSQKANGLCLPVGGGARFFSQQPKLLDNHRVRCQVHDLMHPKMAFDPGFWFKHAHQTWSNSTLDHPHYL